MASRVHRNQSVHALGKMAFGILSTFYERLEKYGEARLLKETGRVHLSVSAGDHGHEVERTEIPCIERPPMIEIEEYRKKFGRVNPCVF
jgi:glucosyl-3-phosphoglycerate synthase